MLVRTTNKPILEIINEEEKWDAVIQDCDNVDFYHTYTYHQFDKKPGEKPILIYFNESNRIIAFPLLLRAIDNTEYFDATSVYGYPGPVTKNIPTYSDYRVFQKYFNEFCKEYRIVSVFSRLNPFIRFQENCLSGLGNLETLGKLVYIDLNRDTDFQKSQYSKRLNTYINKSRNKYTLYEGKSTTDLDAFISLYYANMDRVNAKDSYYFSKDYFEALFNKANFKSTLLFAIDHQTKEIAGGAIFMKYGSFVQYHLSGSKEQYSDLNPIKLLIDEMRIMATKEKLNLLNLGGGLGSREDSLFYFKSGYSKDFAPFKVWKYKANPKVYDDLVKRAVKEGKIEENSSFFPLYRNINS